MDNRAFRNMLYDASQIRSFIYSPLREKLFLAKLTLMFDFDTIIDSIPVESCNIIEKLMKKYVFVNMFDY